MKLKDFKQALKCVDIDYEIFKKRFDKRFAECSLTSILQTTGCSSEILNVAFLWPDTPEGQRYWSNKYNMLEIYERVNRYSREDKLVTFRILAEMLDYKIEE